MSVATAMTKDPKILVLEWGVARSHELVEALRQKGFELCVVRPPEALVQSPQFDRPDVIIMDARFTGELRQLATSLWPGAKLLLVSAEDEVQVILARIAPLLGTP